MTFFKKNFNSKQRTKLKTANSDSIYFHSCEEATVGSLDKIEVAQIKCQKLQLNKITEIKNCFQ